ncbi:MAG TPA: S8/S53 family peptidase [Candidatus Kapabacteria bacterium]|nr:S8/S53 family peptidase [Candidatus Kapabacteria bacterium]
MSRLYYSLVICAGVIIAATAAFPQQVMPGRVLFRISPNAVVEMRRLFTPYISADKHFDPQKCAVPDEEAIRLLLGLPELVTHIQLRPFLAQHNIALESLREQTNPILFSHNTFGIRAATNDIQLLQTSEEHLSRWFELRFDTTISVNAVVVLLKKNHIIEAAEPRFSYAVNFTPNDPKFNDGEQYAPQMMRAPQAWDDTRCDSTMLVAVDDIGTDWTHEDLQSSIFINSGETGFDADGNDKRSNGIDDDGDGFVDDWHGWDFAGSDGTTSDNNPTTAAVHGTHTGGIMAAAGNNGIGICGVAFGSKLLALKCGDDQGQNVAFGYEGIVYAADMGAKVVNNSWGGTGYSQIGQDIVNYATARNCVVVAAAGNYNTFEDLYPASYAHAMSVGAVDQAAGYAGFSDYGTHVTLSAPGVGVVSTVPNNGYRGLDGTSMASPNAAGAVAIVRQKFPNLTPDQSIQRLRVTCVPLVTDTHPRFTGSGLIRLDSALTTKPIYSARIVSVSNDGNQTLISGETANLILWVESYLDPIKNLKGAIELVSPDDTSVVSLQFSSADFGDAATLQTVQNVTNMYLKVASDAPADKVVLFRVTFTSRESNYGPDVDYFSLIINPSYLDLDTNNIRLTISAKGDIGYNDPPSNSQGSGLIWSKPPVSIAPVGRAVLFQGGMMIGTGPDHVVAAAPNANNDNIADQDFILTKRAVYVQPSDHPNAAQEIECAFNDSVIRTNDTTGDSVRIAKEVGVTVRSRSYEFNDPSAANAIVLDYLFIRRTAEDSVLHSDATAAGLYMDWDIGSSGANNVASVSPLDTSIIVTRRNDPNYPLVGMKIISDVPNGAALNHFLINNDGSDGSVDIYNGFAESDKWLTLTTQRTFAGPADVSVVYGMRNIPLASRDSIPLTYIIGLGITDADLKATIDRTEKLWKGTLSVMPVQQGTGDLRCYPNPFTGILHLDWNISGEATIRVIDVLGREVFTQHTSISGATLDLSRLPRGAYHIVLETSQETLHREIIAE